MTDEILTVEQAAEFLKLSPQTVWAMLKSGDLPGRQVGRKWRTTRRALLHYIDGLDSGNKPETGGKQSNN